MNRRDVRSKMLERFKPGDIVYWSDGGGDVFKEQVVTWEEWERANDTTRHRHDVETCVPTMTIEGEGFEVGYIGYVEKMYLRRTREKLDSSSAQEG